MAEKIARLGDSSSHGGMIIASGQDGTVIVEGKEVAVKGALHSCPIEGHGTTSIETDLDGNFYVNGKNVVLNGSIAGCGAVIIATTSKTFGAR